VKIENPALVAMLGIQDRRFEPAGEMNMLGSAVLLDLPSHVSQRVAFVM
jgi:hypothetical protein